MEQHISAEYSTSLRFVSASARSDRLEDLLKQNTDRIRERAADESHIPARLKAMRQKAKP